MCLNNDAHCLVVALWTNGARGFSQLNKFWDQFLPTASTLRNELAQRLAYNQKFPNWSPKIGPPWLRPFLGIPVDWLER
uniref:Uncharacterized protein n=1 Tax=Globodera rostochiensis TaxID=31243 RepID=A0A914HG17_GLORO